MGSIVPETWKRYHFRAETPCIGHYRKYVLRGVTSRYLQSGDQQLEPISTDSTCISWVSHLYMSMFKMLELWCPWIVPVKIHAPLWFFSIARALFYQFTIQVFALVCRLLSLLYMYILFVASYIVQWYSFFLSCVCTIEVVGISVEVKVCFFGKRPWHKWIYMYRDVDMLATFSFYFLFLWHGNVW